MTTYEPQDATTVVTQGVDTMPVHDAGELIDAFAVMTELHPGVPLAHRGDRLRTPHENAARVRWTVPGVRAAEGHVVWRKDVPAVLGALDAAAHALILERGEQSIASRESFTRLLEFPRIPDLASACAQWSPARTVALISDAGGIVPTDRGVWFTRIPAPAACVPVGFNLGAYLGRVFPGAGGDLSDEVLRPALSFYWDAVRGALPEAGSGYCVCGRTTLEHRPTPAQVRRYAAMATSTPP